MTQMTTGRRREVKVHLVGNLLVRMAARAVASAASALVHEEDGRVGVGDGVELELGRVGAEGGEELVVGLVARVRVAVVGVVRGRRLLVGVRGRPVLLFHAGVFPRVHLLARLGDLVLTVRVATRPLALLARAWVVVLKRA